jgi:glycerol-3-phosphate cytidylyltransferase
VYYKTARLKSYGDGSRSLHSNSATIEIKNRKTIANRKTITQTNEILIKNIMAMQKKWARGVTAGAFDLAHAGHVLMFKECKEYCDHLTVFLHTDPSIDRPEKHHPIMSIEERMTILRSNRYIDDIITYDTERQLYGMLEALPEDTVRVIGADWKGKQYTGHDLALPVVFNTRGHSYSSSELRERIYQAEKALREMKPAKQKALAFTKVS